MSYESRHRIADQPGAFVTPVLPRPSLGRRLAAILKLWRERNAARRYLAAMDARSLRDEGSRRRRQPTNRANRSGSPLARCARVSAPLSRGRHVVLGTTVVGERQIPVREARPLARDGPAYAARCGREVPARLESSVVDAQGAG
jgi:uncharacterized protein YjiS (DUF1127 family)